MSNMEINAIIGLIKLQNGGRFTDRYQISQLKNQIKEEMAIYEEQKYKDIYNSTHKTTKTVRRALFKDNNI